MGNLPGYKESLPDMRIVDGEYMEDRDGSDALVQKALVSAGGPLFPPQEWYEDPKLDRPTPITVTADGQVKGHIARWDSSHIGLPPGTKPPRSNLDYAYFKTGVLTTDAQKDVHVGQLTLAGGHAPISASAERAVEHYDDTASAVADITVGEDEFGIWVNGGLRPSVTDEQVRALRASAPSGDWRPINNSLELVAICQVNTPGFPVARAMVASGEITALVAAGASDMYALQQEYAVMAELDRVNARLDEQATIIAALKGHDNGKENPVKPTGSNPFDKLMQESDDSAKPDADSVPVESETSNKAADADRERRKKLRRKFDKRVK